MGLNVWKERDELRDRLEQAEQRAASLQREFERSRLRAREELERADERARLRAAAEFLPVYDQLQLALRADGATEAFLSGVRMTLNHFARLLEAEDIHRMDCEGKMFDPRFHEAVERVDAPDAESGRIVEVLRDGFFSERAGEIVRCAMVKVAR